MSLESSILTYFAELEDPRIARNRAHPLMNIISIAILGVICGADTWVDIERYGKAKESWLNSFLDLRHGIPSHDTFGRVFRWLDADTFQACFMAWTAAICDKTAGKVVAIDGKKLRRSHNHKHERDGIWMVSAWLSENRMVLGQKKVDDKSNEITALPALLAQVDLTDCIVTVDALHTQTTTAQQIVEAGADYILAVKANQGTLHQDLQELFHGFGENAYQNVVYDTAQTLDKAHGREELRQIWVVDHEDYLAYVRQRDKWTQLTSLIKLVTTRVTPTKVEMSTRYFIASYQASAKHFLRCVREHWQIENGLHWVLDIAFREDESRIRKDHAPQNMAVLRHMAVNLLKQETSVKVGIAAKRKMAGWDDDYLLRVVCQ